MECLAVEAGPILLIQRSPTDPVSENYRELSEGEWEQQVKIDY